MGYSTFHCTVLDKTKVAYGWEWYIKNVCCILRRGLTLHAAGVILFHTHPCGGCPEPSMDDRRFTDRMREAGSLIGVRLVDHIVVGHDGTFMSFQSRGLLKG